MSSERNVSLMRIALKRRRINTENLCHKKLNSLASPEASDTQMCTKMLCSIVRGTVLLLFRSSNPPPPHTHTYNDNNAELKTQKVFLDLHC